MKKRCNLCNKKIKSVLPYKCKCDKYYCGLHKIPMEHNCNFDFFKEHKEKLKIQNPKIVAEKINK